ncbi:OmpA family protein [Microseira wollei]|uniref:OmpA/MotB domain-containing protein n=1 Tax=Microseira wollei NIES-4236 TaxID=2530354 RepID=A0AAV3XL71_9CYAN|nr:OmpA family protein [Microseira wollei]GET42680.1 OmpA/MotB domain-containing protein [Microseira wollei NIES-4236]
MTDPSNQDVKNNTPNNDAATEEALAELRSLLLGFETSELDKLHKRLENPNISAEDVSQLLPEAIILRSLKDKQLSEAIVPTVETAIEVSVKRDLNVLADAIFPIIGPATRKAIATALEATIQSLNQVVEHSLSPQSFLWRIEALQTGKSFGEVVMLRTLLYRVEQVFLIHKQTGLLLQHIVAEGVVAMDADLVSAMLTAIQDFVRDSFNPATSNTLETLQYGDLTIWIEQGPYAILAGIIKGNAPKELRLTFQEAIEKIHLRQGNALRNFQGDTATFAAILPYVEACLQQRYKPKKYKVSPILWMLLGGILFGLGSWGFFEFREQRRWADYLEKLQAEPGIVITDAEKRHGKYFISGLRDPVAADPIKILQETEINPKTVVSRWEAYLSLAPETIAARAKKVLQPPKTVNLSVDENGILYASGTAPRRWIVEARRLARTIPGVTKFEEKNLVETELKNFEESRKKIEEELIFLARGGQEIVTNQAQKIQNLVREMQKLADYANVLDKNVRIQIIGHTDKEGPEPANIRLSKARADKIKSILVAQGIAASQLSTAGLGTKNPLRKELSEKDKAVNRSVSFKVIVTDVSQ